MGTELSPEDREVVDMLAVPLDTPEAAQIVAAALARLDKSVEQHRQSDPTA